MRINVYAEELTEETQITTKRPDGFPTPFFGIRLFLESPDVLHSTPDDDDRSAITFWVPWTQANGHDLAKLHRVFEALHDRLDEIVNDLEAAVATQTP